MVTAKASPVSHLITPDSPVREEQDSGAWLPGLPQGHKCPESGQFPKHGLCPPGGPVSLLLFRPAELAGMPVH